ncbi:hypothetical protein D3C80_2080970 [compost metagenome]
MRGLAAGVAEAERIILIHVGEHFAQWLDICIACEGFTLRWFFAPKPGEMRFRQLPESVEALAQRFTHQRGMGFLKIEGAP